MTSEDNMGTKESESGNLLQVDLLSKPNCSLLMSCVHETNWTRAKFSVSRSRRPSKLRHS